LAARCLGRGATAEGAATAAAPRPSMQDQPQPSYWAGYVRRLREDSGGGSSSSSGGAGGAPMPAGGAAAAAGKLETGASRSGGSGTSAGANGKQHAAEHKSRPEWISTFAHTPRPFRCALARCACSTLGGRASAKRRRP
jgi:hypothetical protein